jgi:hypothetical protein
MVTRRQMEELSNRIAKRVHSGKIILFGSYASVRPTEDSDVDSLVVRPFSGRSVDPAVEMRMAARPYFIVRAPEDDFSTMERESRARKAPPCDAVCSHAQQCAEKHRKARLCEAGEGSGKIHDFGTLLDKTLSYKPLREAHREPPAYLSEFAVNVRHPGDKATREDALDARRHGRTFRDEVRKAVML